MYVIDVITVLCVIPIEVAKKVIIQGLLVATDG